jgi:hypothetical protein
LSAKHHKEFAQSFRDGLFQELKLDKDSWNTYWKSVKDFRDKLAAHHEPGFSGPVDFDIALAVAYYYDKWVRKLIFPDTLDELPLVEQFALSVKESVTPMVDKLLGVTEEPK